MKKQSNFAERLTLLMELRSITKSDIAKICGIDRSNITRYCNGEYQAKQSKKDQSTDVCAYRGDYRISHIKRPVFLQHFLVLQVLEYTIYLFLVHSFKISTILWERNGAWH
jgi:transcriptional regulator with XRE-family HTH domain